MDEEEHVVYAPRIYRRRSLLRHWAFSPVLHSRRSRRGRFRAFAMVAVINQCCIPVRGRRLVLDRRRRQDGGFPR